ncbi:MAG: hypothetical protein VKJ24_04780 [Synechococcales bacterium]|nr:hypothetical protein [Synechococcales bacterium]
MSHDHPSRSLRLPAPCIVDRGIVVDKRDMQRLLADLNRVRYLHLQDGRVTSEGEGLIAEVFAEPQNATLVANRSLYLNVCSFDYLEMSQMEDQQACFDLIQDNRVLRIIPISNPLRLTIDRPLNPAALEAVVADVLSASWDAQIDDEEGADF